MKRRRGLTLLELMLVLAILVAVTAMAMPALGRSVESHRLSQGADLVRAAWMRSHVRAMRTGQIQMFRYETAGNKFRTETWRTLEEESPAPSQLRAAGAKSTERPAEHETELPEGVEFVGGDSQFENRSASVEDEVNKFGAGGGNWSRPIIFYPDGSTSNAHIIVGNKRRATIRVDLRGLTGGVNVREVERKP